MTELTLIVELDIEPGKADDFKATAQRLIDATAEEPGTRRYDWYISEDGLRDVNLERFEDSAAFLFHDDHVAPIVPEIDASGALSRFIVLGEPSQPVRERLGERDAEFHAPYAGIGRFESGALTLLLDLEIQAGRRDDFDAAAQTLVKLTAQEPGTVAYDWYVSADGSRIRIIEAFEDAAAHAAHVEHLDRELQTLFTTASIRESLVIGDPGASRERFAQRGASFFSFFSGLPR